MLFPLSLILFAQFFFQSAEASSSSPSLSMDPESRVRHEKRFGCDACDRRFTRIESLRSHRQAVHPDAVLEWFVFNCPKRGCVFSSSRRTDLAKHVRGFHGTAGLIACDHPGCTFQSTWRCSIYQHKRRVHIDAKPFACDHNGCAFRSNTRGDLSRHKDTVHLNIRNKPCHVCEKRFDTRNHLIEHMHCHEEDGHEMKKCQQCSVNLKTKSSRKTKPAAIKWFPCDHPGCDYKSRWKNNIVSHQIVHTEERPFSCNYAGCSYRCKLENNLKNHENHVHIKLKTKCCHICSERFFRRKNVRDHMISKHQTDDHDVDKCEDCVKNLKKNERMCKALAASRVRKAKREGTKLQTAKKHVIVSRMRKVGGNKEVALEKAHARSWKTRSLNDDLIDIHMDMQLLSSR